jgi:hypothetical protein
MEPSPSEGMYRDVFGIEISCGSLVNMFQRFAEKASNACEKIRRRDIFL